MRYLVIGGGIAGVCCVEEVCRLSNVSDSVTLISAGRVFKVCAWLMVACTFRLEVSQHLRNAHCTCRASPMSSDSHKTSRASKVMTEVLTSVSNGWGMTGACRE